MSKIIWEVKTHAGENGYVPLPVSGRIKVASIDWSMDRDDRERPWILRTTLPGYTNDRRHADLDSAKQSAERILTSFATIIRPPAPDLSEVRLAAGNAHESSYPDAAFGDFLHGFQCAVNWLTRGRG